MDEEKQAQPEDEGLPPPFPAEPVKAEYRIGDWIGKAWQLATAQIWPMVLLALLGAVVPAILSWIVCFPIGFAIGKVVNNPIAAQVVAGFLGGIAGWVISALVIVQLMVGVLAVVLAYIRTGQVNYSLLGTGFNKYGDCFMLAVWPGILTVAASALSCFVLLVLPLYFALLLWYMFGQFALAETGVTHSQAVDRGLALVKSNFWAAVLLMLLGVGLGLAGALACCIGALFAVPLFWLTVGIGYVELTAVGASGPATEISDSPSA